MRLLITILLLALAPLAGAQTRGDFSPEETAELRKVFAELADARASIAEAERTLIGIILGHGPTIPPIGPPVRPPVDPPVRPPVDPPVRPPVDPPVDPPVRPPVDPPGNTWPDLPFDAPAIPEYHFPTLADCEWTVEAGVFTSTRGLDPVSNVRDAFRVSMGAGHETPITFGVWDEIGRAIVGGLWNENAEHSITMRDAGGSWMADISVEFLGLDDSCEVSLGWSKNWGFPAYVGAFNIGLRGQNDSFIIRANEGVDRLVIDGCWWLASKTYGPGQFHASGMHIDEWKTLVWRNHKFRGVLPTDPGTLFREHSGYLKSCIGGAADGGTWLVANNLLGGNRTGFQIRPETGHNPRPTGPIVIAYNYSDGFGWTHGDTPATSDGGGLMTSWVGPESNVYVFGNRHTDARYACLVISGQTPEKNWLNEAGHPIANVYVYDNVFESNRAGRGCVSLSAAAEIHYYENDIDGPLNGDLKFNSAWNMRVNSIEAGAIMIHGQDALDQVKALDSVKTWDPADPAGKDEIQISDETLDSYLVPR